MTENDSFAEGIGAALRRDFAHYKCPDKVISRLTERPRRTVQNWMYCIYPPKSEDLIVLMVISPSVAKFVYQILMEAHKRIAEKHKDDALFRALTQQRTEIEHNLNMLGKECRDEETSPNTGWAIA